MNMNELLKALPSDVDASSKVDKVVISAGDAFVRPMRYGFLSCWTALSH
jgi:hypothetical protein